MAAEEAALLAADGMRIGLGTGSTVAFFLPALARRRLDVVCVATSPQTEAGAKAAGLRVEPFLAMSELDLAVDGADQVSPELWLVKGGGGAHTREKVVAASAKSFVVIVSADKLVDRIRPPIPLEVLRFGLDSTLVRLAEGPGQARVRDAFATPDGNVVVDYEGPIEDPADLSAELSAIPGVIDHGLFEPRLVDQVLVGRQGRVDRLTPSG